MPRILLENYSTFYDYTTHAQFNPVMDKRSGCFVAIADVSEKEAAAFEARPKFRRLTDDEWLAMTSTPKPVEPTAPTTGEPLADAAINPPAQAKNPPKTGQAAPDRGAGLPTAFDLSVPPPPPPSN